ncbi:hypothetical protein KIN20_036359 [Parelaphostrongylus tenuis]|uniref:Uncharacterized protein n=1 Tax=Parelaphostrongylus tenuis TaxID=148309 RepID=A0AAD5WKC3_PARTN|nr:hypothetical protein KIN20_036359 [Parelaphostrongylus tenuis]
MFLELVALVLFFITLCKIVDEDCKKRINSALINERNKYEVKEAVIKITDPVFVAPPPPREDPNMSKPRPRLCELEKSSQSEEFRLQFAR